MLRIYLVPPGTGYFFACVCILIATAALYVGAGVAAGFPPHYGALTPEAYVDNYGITAQLCLRPSPNLLPHPCSYKRGKYIQYSRPFITFV